MKAHKREVKLSGLTPVKIKRNLGCYFLFRALMIFILALRSFAQSGSPAPSPTPAATPSPSLEKRFFANVLKDQYAIWTSPFHLRGRDASWLAPLGAASVALFATDKRTAGALDNDETRLRISRDVSRFGTGYAVGGAAAAFYLIGRATHNMRARETGILAAEALIDSGIVAQTVKFATQRPRPLDKGGTGRFFSGGNSFPSGHSTSIWSLAAVIDGEYARRRPLVRVAVYGLATAVSLSRYTGRNHFLSDVLVGSVIGYGVGHFVFSRHHDTNLDLPDGTKKTTKMEKYFPRVLPQYDPRNRTYAAALAWNF